MRLIIECEHGFGDAHGLASKPGVWCCPKELDNPDAILAALAEAGVLEVERKHVQYNWTRYVSSWKEAK